MAVCGTFYVVRGTDNSDRDVMVVPQCEYGQTKAHEWEQTTGSLSNVLLIK